MATVGSALEEKGVEESEESADVVWSPLADMCRKNGFSNAVQSNEKSCKSMDSKLTKYNCIVKINGLKNLVHNHSKQAPATRTGLGCRGLSSSVASSVVQLRRTRSERNHMSSEGSNVKPKNKVRGGHDNNLRDLSNQTQSGSLNNNKEDASLTTVDTTVELIEGKQDQAEEDQDILVHRCDTTTSKHSGNNPSKVFHLKDVDNVKEKVATNGHRISLRRVHQNLHQNGLSLATQPSRLNGRCVNVLCTSSSQQLSASCPTSSQSLSTLQLIKAANPSSSSSALSSSENSNLSQGCNGTITHIHPEPRVVLGRLALTHTSATSIAPSLSSVIKSLSSSSSLSPSSSCTLTRSSSSSSLPITSHTSCSSSYGGLVHRSQSTSSSLFLLNQDNSCSSTSSLVSTSSQEGSSTTIKDHHDKSQKLSTCRWSRCGQELEPARLMDHLQTQHVESQGGESFVCLWEGCKVYDKASCSKKWLDRHILCHSGDKPFPCIVDGCGQQFTSQYGLERHVNSHFNSCRPSNKQPVKSKEDTPSKQSKKKKVPTATLR